MAKQAKKLTDQEFKEVQNLKNEAIQYASALGELEYQKVSIQLQMDSLKDSIKQLKAKEEQFFNKIRSSYGSVTINIDTGEIS